MDRIKFMHEVFDLVMQVNGGAERRSGKGHPTAFFEYSGHVNCLYVKVYPDGWTGDLNQEAERFQFDFDLYSDNHNLATLDKLKKHAEEIGGEQA